MTPEQMQQQIASLTADNGALRSVAESAAEEHRRVVGERDRTLTDLTVMRQARDRLALENSELVQRVKALEEEHRATLAQLEQAELRAGQLKAEISRLSALARSITGEVCEYFDSGEYDEVAMAMIGIGIHLGREVESGHSCGRCGGAGWWWEDTPEGEFDVMLRRCEHAAGGEAEVRS